MRFQAFFRVSSLSARPSQPLFSLHVFVYLSYYQTFILKNHATPPFAVFPPFPCACQMKGITLHPVRLFYKSLSFYILSAASVGMTYAALKRVKTLKNKNMKHLKVFFLLLLVASSASAQTDSTQVKKNSITWSQELEGVTVKAQRQLIKQVETEADRQ